MKLLSVQYFRCAQHASAGSLVFWTLPPGQASAPSQGAKKGARTGWRARLQCSCARGLVHPPAVLQLESPSALLQIQARWQTFVPTSTSHGGHPADGCGQGPSSGASAEYRSREKDLGCTPQQLLQPMLVIYLIQSQSFCSILVVSH